MISTLVWMEPRYRFPFTGQSGGTVRRCRKTIQNLMEDLSSPDCVFLQIGGNDLSEMGCEPFGLTRDIVSFSSFLAEAYMVKHVIIGQLFFTDFLKGALRDTIRMMT